TFASETNRTMMAKAFVVAAKGRKLAAYEDPEGTIRRDFAKFNIDHKPPSTYTLKAVSDEFGHADVGTAIIIALPRAMALINVPLAGLGPEDELFVEDDSDLTEEELKDMPEELRELYETPAPKRAARARGRAAEPDDFDLVFDF